MGRAESGKLAAARRYFEEVDRGEFCADLFAAGFEFYFPRVGKARGAEAFRQFLDVSQASGRRVMHHLDQLRFIESDRHVVVEGTTEGITASGEEWSGGRTPAGRFCSVFSFDDQGLIERMYVYLDPGIAEANALAQEGRQTEW